MSFRETALKKLANICTKLGKSNGAINAVIVIAVCKGTFRPLYSLRDKKESPETRKYTALREFLTEAVAIPSYYFISKGAEKLGSRFNKPVAGADAVTNLAKVEKSLSFLAICGTAVFVIPYLCNLVIKPIMENIVNKKKTGSVSEKKPVAPNNNINPNLMNIQDLGGKNNQTQVSYKGAFVNTYTRPASVSSMRVGN